MTVVMNRAAILERGITDPELARHASQVVSAAECAAVLTDQLRGLSRGRRPIPVDLDLNQVVSELAELVDRALVQAVSIVVAPTEGPLIVRADRGQLDLVLLNLLVNARDAMPGGGVIIVESRAERLDEPPYGAGPDFSPGDCVTLSVSDTGVGMDPVILA